jgi:hypothetical protein
MASLVPLYSGSAPAPSCTCNLVLITSSGCKTRTVDSPAVHPATACRLYSNDIIGRTM